MVFMGWGVGRVGAEKSFGSDKLVKSRQKVKDRGMFCDF
jgi:hypothetical protein